MADNRTTTARRITLAKATSAMALATGLALGASGPAHAQAAGAFEGTPTVVSGNVSINRGTNTDNIRVDSSQAVINWTTNDTALTGGPINFLPSGRTAFYRNNPTAQNQFTVLNRIIPTGTSRSIQFNGTIISQLQTASGLVSGGNVWFYSPGGIVVNSTAVIDVGGLLLTSSDPVRDGAGNFINASGSFTLGPSASASSVIVQPGAQITATPENSYIAMVAPTVLQGGNVNVNGSALYVGAEAATITFGGNGLFDIQVTTGTDGSSGVAVGHGGTTTGPASSGAGDNHRIYMVAVPKNNAITMALSGGNLGFAVAGAANAVGNSIILSSGYNVFGDTIDTNTAVNPAQQSNISIRDINISSAINAAAANELQVLALTGNVSFAGRADLYGANTARVDADGATRTVTFASDLFLSADDFGINPGEAALGGLAVLRTANSGSISIAGSAFLSAAARGADNFTTGSVGSGTGGRVDLVNSTGGSLLIGGNLTVDVQGFAGGSGTTGIGSNFGRGGNVGLFALDGNASLRVNGTTTILAQGVGSSDFGSAAGTGGAGFGGRIDVFARGTGNAMRFGGAFVADVVGSGGQSTGSGLGGAGTGGQTFISTDGQSRLDFLSDLSMFSFGFGGDAAGTAGATGGVATGGTASLSMEGANGIIAVGGNLLMQASANGGQGRATGTNGALATGGTAIIFQNASAGQISVAGTSRVESFGIGGQGTIGGDGVGGRAQVVAQNTGTLAFSNTLNVDGSGLGGTPNTVGAGRSGNGIGSTLTQIVATGGGVINVTGDVTVSANGAVFGNELAGTDGGNGTGGNASISQATGGRITIDGNALVSAFGTGDANFGGGDGIAGNGTGGDARIAVNDLNITITGNATVDASGFGGANFGGLRGGTGTGGIANLGAGAGTLSIGGNGEARANAIGGSSSGTGSGGDGVAGQALIGSIAGGIIQIAGTANATAQGFGGNASGTGNTGGLGDGGTAQLFAANTGSVTVGGITTMSAGGFGGSVGAGASSGAALGGLVSLLSQGNGQITLNQDVFLSGQALSGNVDDGAGNSAAATGGTVNVFAVGAGGSITVNGRLFADAITGVGSALTGTIGDALGGTVQLVAGPGTINVTGAVSLDSTAFGGNSNVSGNGGNATGGRTAVVISSTGNGTINLGSTLTMASNAFGGLAHTGNGGNATGGLSEEGSIDVAGSFTFGGAVSMSANGTGGDSVIVGNGGTGTGGESRFGSNNAQMTGRDLFIAANGRGGNGALGGRGGDATGGLAFLNSGPGTVVGLLDFDNVVVSADAFGGTGGAGADGATGGAGGAGGNATGGLTRVLGSARNGQLDIGNLQVTMNGFGGVGGAGGAGTAGVGGNGGAGGIGTGGSTLILTVSNTITTGPNPTPTGFIRMLDAVVEANGFGGAGGDGGTGTTGIGNGGNGGLGDAGDIFFATRGSLIQVNNLTMLANATGGNGGNGAVRGNGGNAIGGLIGLESAEQFQAPTNRGRLVANNITAIARGTAGLGAVNGRTFYETGSFFRAINGDVTANSIVFNIGNAGDAAEPTGIVEDFVRVTNATVNAGTSFTFITPGQLSALVSNGTLSAAAVGLVAGTFIADTVVTAPTNIGAINTNALALQSSGNLIVTANLNVVQNLAISVPGTVDLRNISGGGLIGISGSSLTLGNLGSGNGINLTSTTGAITAGNMTAANFIAMTAANGLTLGLATSNTGFVDLLVRAGNLTVGNVTAGTFISLEATNGSIQASNLTSGAETDLDATGSVTFGTAVTGLSFAVQTNGNITGGNITSSGVFAGDFYGIGLATQTGTIQVGALTAINNVGLLATGAINTGAISTGASFIGLGGSNIAIGGPLTAGTGPNNFVYFGNASMASSLGANFNPAPVFALTPVRTPGSVTINGAVQGGNVLAGVGTALNVNGGITANGGRIGITANSVTAQNISSAFAISINATNGNLQLGNVLSTGTPTAGGIVLLASGTINAGTISTGTTPGLGVTVDGGGAVSIGGVTATGAAQLRSRAASFTSTGAITAGSVAIGGVGVTLRDVTSLAGQIDIGAGAGNLNFGALTSSANTQFSATGSVTGGDITAGTWIGTNVGGNMTLGNLRTTGPGVSPTSGFSIGLGANGTITTGTISSFGLLGIGANDAQGNFTNATAITTGAITSGGTAIIRANNAISTGSINATGEIRVRAGTNLTTGALTATGPILAAALGGNLVTGSVGTGGSALLLASQNITTGAISTGTTGTAYLGNSSPVSNTGNVSAIDLNALLAAAPIRTGSNISIGGPVTTGALLAASNGGFSANGAITAGSRITINTAGTAVFGGLAAAPTISVASSDIAFSQAGGLGNANTSSLTLTNSGDGLMIIGGTTQSETYVLDASEISRLRAGNIVISSPTAGTTGTGIEIRAFTLNGSNATSGVNLNGGEGSISFQTTNTIRVNGNAVFNAMATSNRVAFSAGRVEINADTGGIFLNGSSPGGTLSISANNIHIASAELLGRLAENVNFTGRDTALSLPIATSRPDGVIQASRLQFNVGSTLLIQNTGTSLLNAGLFGRVGSVEITPRSSSSQSASAGLIDLVIYGQLLDTGDIVRNGTSVRDLIFPRSSSPGVPTDAPISSSRFTSNSSVNGCLLTAVSCGGGGITETGPTAVVHAGPPPPRPAEEREAEREQEEAEAAAEEAARGEAAPRRPIMPPVTIVNTRRLGVEPIIDEPVTSGGNPNLQLDQALPDTGGQP